MLPSQVPHQATDEPPGECSNSFICRRGADVCTSWVALKERLPALTREVQLMLLPRDEADARSAILEIRPAAGGDEAGERSPIL